jgi:hypothetical protein
VADVESLVTLIAALARPQKPAFAAASRPTESSTGTSAAAIAGVKTDHLEKTLHPQIVALSHFFHCGFDHYLFSSQLSASAARTPNVSPAHECLG